MGGRPIEYTDEYVTKLEQYLEECKDTFGEDNKLKVKIPTIEGAALALGVHRDTLYDWESKYTQFSDIIVKLRNMQAERLVNNGLSGSYNSTIAKVLLTKHGYREGIENTGKDGTPLQITLVEYGNNNPPQVQS